MNTIPYILVSSLIIIVFSLRPGFKVSNLLNWKFKIIGLFILLVGQFSYLFVDASKEEPLRYLLAIIGLSIITMSKDKNTNRKISSNKSEILLFSFLSAALGFILPSLIGIKNAEAIDVNVFVVSVLLLYVISYNALLLKKNKNTVD